MTFKKINIFIFSSLLLFLNSESILSVDKNNLEFGFSRNIHTTSFNSSVQNLLPNMENHVFELINIRNNNILLPQDTNNIYTEIFNESIRRIRYSDTNSYAIQISENDSRVFGFFTYRTRLYEIIRNALNEEDISYRGRNLATFFIEIYSQRQYNGNPTLEFLAPNAVDREYLGNGHFAFTYASTRQGHSERNGWNELRNFSFGNNNRNFINFIYTERQPCSGRGPNCDQIIREILGISNVRNPNLLVYYRRTEPLPFVFYQEEYPSPQDLSAALILNRLRTIPQFIEDEQSSRTRIREDQFNLMLDANRRFVASYRRSTTSNILRIETEIVDGLIQNIRNIVRNTENTNEHNESLPDRIDL